MCRKKNGIAEPWQYLTPSQLGLRNTDVHMVQRLVGAIPDEKIGRETIYNMIAYIYRNEIQEKPEKQWYDYTWRQRKMQKL